MNCILRSRDVAVASNEKRSTLQDFDNDGWPELLVTADHGVSRMFWNNRNGNFTECTGSCSLDAMQVHE